MEFYSLQFIFFISLWLVLYYGSGRLFKGRKWVVLLGASLSFYAILEWKGVCFLLATAGTTWLSAGLLDVLRDRCREERKKLADRKEKAAVKFSFQKKRRRVLVVCLLLNFGILALLKYTGDILKDISGWKSIMIPIGISFYTFQSISYLIDVYNEKYES